MPNKPEKDNCLSAAERRGDHSAVEGGLLSRVSGPPRDAQTVREFRLRLPGAVIEQLRSLSHTKRCSMNAVVADYLDKGFRADGHTGIDELAPGFADYLRRDRAMDGNASAEQSDSDGQCHDTAMLHIEFT